jgi:hypothetical protein
MPDYNGVLTESERETVQDWVKSAFPQGLVCPVSKHRQWILADHVVIPVVSTPLGTEIGGTGYPQIMVTCEGCGLTLYFNAVKTGIMRSE